MLQTDVVLDLLAVPWHPIQPEGDLQPFDDPYIVVEPEVIDLTFSPASSHKAQITIRNVGGGVWKNITFHSNTPEVVCFKPPILSDARSYVFTVKIHASSKKRRQKLPTEDYRISIDCVFDDGNPIHQEIPIRGILTLTYQFDRSGGSTVPLPLPMPIDQVFFRPVQVLKHPIPLQPGTKHDQDPGYTETNTSLQMQKHLMKLRTKHPEPVQIEIQSSQPWLNIAITRGGIPYPSTFKLSFHDGSARMWFEVDHTKLSPGLNRGEIILTVTPISQELQKLSDPPSPGPAKLVFPVVVTHTQVAPRVMVRPAHFDLGPTWRGEKRTAHLHLENQTTQGIFFRLVDPPPWVVVNPDSAKMIPGQRSRPIHLEVDTSILDLGPQSLELRIGADDTAIPFCPDVISLDLDVYCYLTDHLKLDFEKVRIGEIKPLSLNILHSHDYRTSFIAFVKETEMRVIFSVENAIDSTFTVTCHPQDGIASGLVQAQLIIEDTDRSQRFSLPLTAVIEAV